MKEIEKDYSKDEMKIYKFILDAFICVCDELENCKSDSRRIKLTGERKAYKNILDGIRNKAI